MAEAYPEVLRSRVIRAYEMGEGSYATIATQWHLGTATVKRWVAKQRREGHVRSHPKAGGTTSRITAVDLEALLVALGDPTAGELTATYNRPRRGRGRVHVSSMKRALHRHDYVVKKTAAAGGDGAASRLPLARRRARRDPTSPLVFHHDGIPVRCWRTTSVETWQTWPMNAASTWLQDAYPTTWESSPK